MRTDVADRACLQGIFRSDCLAAVAAGLIALAVPQMAAAQSRAGASPYSSNFWSSGYFWPTPPGRVYRRPAPTPRREARPKPAPAPIAKASSSVIAGPPAVPVTRADTGQGPPAPLVAVISLSSQRLQVYGADGEIAETRVSTGKTGHTTPTGVFSVLQRNRHHHSNLYSNAPMPYMQRLTWSGIALHEGVVPGYPASHGCVRLPSGFASRLWSLGRIGMRVVIAPHDVQPGVIEDARLPVPLMSPAATAVAQPLLQTIAADATPRDGASSAQIAPFALAQAKRSKALADKAAAERELKSAAAQATERSSAANAIGERLRAATARLASLEEELDERQREFARVQTEEAEARLKAALAEFRVGVEAARTDAADLKVLEIAASDAAFDAAKIARAARDRVEAASDDVQSQRSALEPISIFVSRKDGKVFVRQGFRDIHQEPIVIDEPARPLGTHVFTAMSESDNGARLNWQVVTVPLRDRGETSSPSQALERFTLPDATMQLVRERLWPGATLIVSDSGLGPETGAGTDFVVLTR